MKEEMSLVELFVVVKKRITWIINAVLIGVLIAAVYTFIIATPEYSSTTQLLVNRTQQTDVIQRADIDTNVQLINTYKDIITGPVILDEVREILDLDISHNDIAEKISIRSENNSQVFSIQVNDTNPYQAATIANTTASVFQENLDEIMNVDNITVISEAMPSFTPVSPNNLLNLVIGLVIGGVLGFGISFVVELLDNTVKEDQFITEVLGWTNLGKVSEMTADELKPNYNKVELELRTRTAKSRV